MRKFVVFLFVMAFASIFSGCSKSNALLEINRTISTTTYALNTVDLAYQNGFLSSDDHSTVYQVGFAVNHDLYAINNFIAALPNDVIEGRQPIVAEDKAKLLGIVSGALSRSHQLVESGNYFRNNNTRNNFLKYSRPAQTLLQQLKTIVAAWPVKNS